MRTSLFAGIISPLHSLRVSKEIAIQALQFSDKPQTIWTSQGDTYLLAQCIPTNQSSDPVKSSSTFFFKKNRYVVVTWSRLDNRCEVASKVHIHPHELSTLGDADLVLESYLRFGSDCVKHLVGDFSFVIYDTVNRMAYCARDPLGTRPFFYAQTEHAFIFSTQMAFFHQLSFFKSKIDRNRLAEYVLGLTSDLTTTVCTNIQKLPPGHTLTYHPEQIQVKRYYVFDPYKTLYLKDKREYIEAYKTVLQEAVRCRLPANQTIGAELSGGLDSSSVIGVALECDPHLRETLHTFSHDKQDLDGPCIDEALDYWHLQGPHHRFDNDVQFTHRFNSIPKTVAWLGYLEEATLASFHHPFYQRAEAQGVQILFSGAGGDEFVTQRTRVVILELLSKGQFKKAWQTLHGKSVKRAFRLLKQLGLLGYYQWANKCCFDKSWLRALKERFPLIPLAARWKENPVLKEGYFAIAQTQGYFHVNEHTLEKLLNPLVVARLETCSILVSAYKIEYAWPLLDIRLIELFLSIPPEYKWYQGMTRFLHREAMKGKIPERIRQQPTKIMGEMKPRPATRNIASVNHFFSHMHHPLFYEIVDMKKIYEMHHRYKNETLLNGEGALAYYWSLFSSMQLASWLKYYFDHQS